MNEIRDAIGLAVAPFIYALFVWIVPKVWRNERGMHTDTPPPSWPWSLAFWHALIRVWMPLAISLLVCTPPAVVNKFLTDGPVWVACNIVLALGAFVWAFAIPSVWLFNRPRFLLAPHHRALPGWLAERRGASVPAVPEPAKPPRWHAATR